MTDWQATRPGETSAPLPGRHDAHLVFIGRIRTPFVSRDQCPRQGSQDGPLCRVEIEPAFQPALQGIEAFTQLDLLYWMHEARRDLLTQSPRGGASTGTFALRSPVRPNPVALSRVKLEGVKDGVLLVRGLDCLDGTPLIDIKPHRCMHPASATTSPDKKPSPPTGAGRLHLPPQPSS
ncbi:tRNA (N6-threonylcarbamoyladenosine(37)-N6)-methyltransferase TrmO [Bosea sp. (in: a-proteobacteria)]|uniref:tRNA (N6-threonylcarbamoyladenosine(37)-N6)-methyltransferase TrmO n=1 Tax=Bosea sp. (in: a-proteobacteria) TaxID=1871050 RepID=UPI002FCBA891